MNQICKICGSQVRKGSTICTRCRSDQLNPCKIKKFTYKKGDFVVHVPWCLEKDERIVFSHGGCSECEYYKKEE